MRIAVNADYLADQESRIGTWLMNLLTGLGTIDGVNEYLLLSWRPIKQKPRTPSTFVWQDVTFSWSVESARPLRWEQYNFPDTARRHEAKVLFVPDCAPPLMTAIPTVVMVHDLKDLLIPEYRPESARRLYQQLLLQRLRKIARIIVPSHTIKAQLIEMAGIDVQRIAVISGAPQPGFRPVVDFATLRRVRTRYHLGDRFLVYSGGFDLCKQIPLLLGAFAAAMHRLQDVTTQLVLLGDTDMLGTSPLYPDWRPLIRTFGLDQRVVLSPVLPEDLAAIYSDATGFVTAATMEGFGWDVINAMSCGAPVIVPSAGALAEMVDNAGLIAAIPPGDIDIQATRSVARQIVRLLGETGVREEYHARSLARARTFSWTQTAAECSALFADVAGIRI